MAYVKIELDDEQNALFESALSAYSQIVKRKVSKAEFARFAMMWFVSGFMRDDVGDSQEGALCHVKE